MDIGIPKERKCDERRVALRPDQVKLLVDAGHTVWLEAGAGAAAGYEDRAYIVAGAECVPQSRVYENARLLLKIKSPLPEELPFLKPHHVLFAYLHFDENLPAPLIEQIVATGVTAIAYEWVAEGHRYPLLEPMSELTGAVLARQAMGLLMHHKGVLAGRYLSQWPAGRAMVIGVGHIGANAINVLVRNAFHVTVVDKTPATIPARLSPYLPLPAWEEADKEILPFDESDPDGSVAALRERVPKMDIVICAAVRRPTLPKTACEYLIRREDVTRMEPNSIICDATACDKDLIETCLSSESLTHFDVTEKVLHYNCDHIPSLVPRTATELLTNATMRYIPALCEGFERAVRGCEPLARGVMCYRGALTHEYSARKKQLPYTPLAQLLQWTVR